MKNIRDFDEYLDEIRRESPEDYAAIEFEANLIIKMAEIRRSLGFSQQDLADASGIKQSAIARIERMKNSPQIDTLIRLLVPLGYTLAVVPLSTNPGDGSLFSKQR